MPKILSRDPAWLATGTPGFSLFQPDKKAPSKRESEAHHEGAQRRIAHRGTELFVAVGNELRWSEVGVLKDAADDLGALGREEVQNGDEDGGAGYRVSTCCCYSQVVSSTNTSGRRSRRLWLGRSRNSPSLPPATTSPS